MRLAAGLGTGCSDYVGGDLVCCRADGRSEPTHEFTHCRPNSSATLLVYEGMDRTHSTRGRLALLAAPLLTASLVLALSACGSSVPTSSSLPATNAGASANAHLQLDRAVAAAAEPAGDPVTVTVTPSGVCPGTRATITMTVGGAFKLGHPPMKVVGAEWDIRMYNEDGDLVGLPTLLHTRGKTLEFEWGSRVPGIYVMFIDVTGAPGSSGSTMAWFVVLPEYACQKKEPPAPAPAPTPKPTPTSTQTSTPTPTPKPTTTTAKP
jgi:hypothetical protein